MTGHDAMMVEYLQKNNTTTHYQFQLDTSQLNHSRQHPSHTLPP